MKAVFGSVPWRKATLSVAALLLLALLVIGWVQRDTMFPRWFPKVLRGHAGLVYAVAISPDGKIVASGSGDNNRSRGEVRLWDTRTGRLLSSLRGREGVWTLAFSPDGKTLAMGTTWGGLAMWDVQSGRLRQLLAGNPHIGWIWSVAFSPDGKTLVAQKDGELLFWNVSSGSLLWKLTWRKQNSTMVAFSPDGKELVSMAPIKWIRHPATVPELGASFTFTKGQAQLLDVKTGRILQNLPFEQNSMIQSAAFSPDGKTLALISENMDEEGNMVLAAVLKTVDLATNKVKWVQTLQSGVFSAVLFAPDGGTVVTEQTGEKVSFWDAQTGKPRLTLKNGIENLHQSPYDIAFSHDGRYLVSQDGKNVKIWRADLLRR